MNEEIRKIIRDTMGEEMKKEIVRIIEESISVKTEMIQQNNVRLGYNVVDEIEKAIRLITYCMNKGGKLLLFGNGGSAADCQHIAAEFVNKFKRIRKALPAIALTTDTSILTSISNDFDYRNVFSRQVDALGNEGDVALGISTSGQSYNVSLGLCAAKHKNLKTIVLTGEKIGEMLEYSDIKIMVSSIETPRIQECHIMIGHIICEIVEKEFININGDSQNAR